MIIGISREIADGEKRVAINPESAAKLIELFDAEVRIEPNAGVLSGYDDSLYREIGARIADGREEIFRDSDLILSVDAPPDDNLRQMKRGSVLICFLWALQNPERVELLKELEITALGLDTVPRISRAQTMDALSSMSNIAGYKSVLIGAGELDRYLPMMMTAAGTIPPAKVLVLGAGVAGLQAIATARRLGAVVEAYDIRPAVKEQVESLGARFVEVPAVDQDTETEGGYAKEISELQKEKQLEVMHKHVRKSDIVITTALIPGKKAPLLVPASMVEVMKAGSVIVDLAAEQGGNCELTRAGETVVHNGVKIIGPLNLPSSLAHHASQLYSKNLLSLLTLLEEEKQLNFNFEDEIILKTTVTHRGEIISPMLKENDAGLA